MNGGSLAEPDSFHVRVWFRGTRMVEPYLTVFEIMPAFGIHVISLQNSVVALFQSLCTQFSMAVGWIMCFAVLLVSDLILE